MKYFIFIILSIFAIANLEGKRTYHNNNLDKKVEFTKRHEENPLGTTAHKKDPLKKVTTETKTKLHNLLNQPNEYKKLELEKKHIELQKKMNEKKVIKETKSDIKEFEKGLKIEPKKKVKNAKKKKEEIRKKKGYRK